MGFSQRKNGLPSLLALSRNLSESFEDLVVHGLHPFGIERAGVLDPLLADLAPARLLGRVVSIGRPGMHHVARADLVLELRRVVGMGRVFHRIQVIEVAEELVEAVHGRQELVAVAQVVLAELTRCIAHRLEDRRGGRRLRGQADRGARLADGRHAGADRELAGDEVGTPGRAARLGVVVGEQHPLRGEPVEVRRPAGHHAPVVGADVEPADVVAHDDDDVRLLSGSGRFALGRCVLGIGLGKQQVDGRSLGTASAGG